MELKKNKGVQTPRQQCWDRLRSEGSLMFEINSPFVYLLNASYCKASDVQDAKQKLRGLFQATFVAVQCFENCLSL